MLVAQHQAEPELLARLLLRRRAQPRERAQLADRAVPVADAQAQAEQPLAQLRVVGLRLDDALELLDRAGDVAGVLGEHLRELELDLAAALRSGLGGEVAPPQRDGETRRRPR